MPALVGRVDATPGDGDLGLVRRVEVAGLVPGLDDRVARGPSRGSRASPSRARTSSRRSAGRPSQRAARTRSRWPWAKSRPSPVDVRVEAAGEDPVGRARRPRRGSRRPATARSRSSSPGTPCGCRRSSGPRARRSPTPAGRGRRIGVREAGEARPSRRRATAGWSGRARTGGRRAAGRGRRPARARRRSAGCPSGRCAARAAPIRSRRGGRARSGARPAGVAAHSSRRPGGRRSSGVGGEERSRGASRRARARSIVGQRRDPRVVAIDLVVVELAAVGDHRLEALDLVLQVEDVRCDLEVRVAPRRRRTGSAPRVVVASLWTAWSGIGSVGE